MNLFCFFFHFSEITDDSFIGSVKDVILRGVSQKIKTGYNYKLGFKPSVSKYNSNACFWRNFCML